MAESIFQVISRHHLPSNRNEESTIVWHNSVLTVRTEKGLAVLKVSIDPSAVSKVINYVEHFIFNPKSSASQKLISPKFLQNLKSNFDYTQTIHDQTFWPCNPALMKEKCIISKFEWSPELLTCNNQCVLATLTNVGNVELLVFQRYGFTQCSNVTKEYITSTGEKCVTAGCEFNVMKKILYKYASSAICWQPTFNSDKSFNFVTAQKNGDIIIWSVKSSDNTVSINLRSVINTEDCEIYIVKLFEISPSYLLLIFANCYGQVYCYKLNADNVTTDTVCTLWEYKDKTIVSNLIHFTVKGCNVVCFNKNRHLIIQLLNDSCEIVNQYIQNINDHKIGSIIYKNCCSEEENILYLNTNNSKLYEVCIEVNNLVLNVKLKELQIAKDIIAADHVVYGVSLSKETGILFLLLTYRTVTVRANQIKLEIFLLSNKSDEHFISLLLNNPTKELTNVYECLEYVRMKVIKNRVLPAVDFVRLYTEGESDIYKLKLYLFFLHYFHSLRDLFVCTSVMMPELSIEKVKEKIFFVSAKSRVLHIYENFNENMDNAKFLKESFAGAVKYLKYYCNKYEENLHSHVTKEILGLVDEEFIYECQGCDKKIDHMTCSDGHPNTFCFLTFTPIDSDEYLFCEVCSFIARVELASTKPKCILCDRYLSVDFDKCL